MIESLSAYDVCNMDRLYDKEAKFEYSLPRDVLESYLSGDSFDYKKKYTKEELERVKADIRQIYQAIVSKHPIKEPVAILTCGGPGSGKTTLLKQQLEKLFAVGIRYAYVCPDDVCLKQQTQTYQQDLKTLGLEASYTKWRPASNAATHLILGNLIRERYAFSFGTTTTHPQSGRFLAFLKSRGYKIHLLHVSAADDVKYKSIALRDKEFIQTTAEDVKAKGKMLQERILDTYLHFADKISFYYRPKEDGDAVLAATWERCSEKDQPPLGSLCIKNDAAYKETVTLHDTACKEMGKEALFWERTVQACSKS